jgi:Leishmanolysin
VAHVLSGDAQLRASVIGNMGKTEKDMHQQPRQSVIRRLYGPENAHVRRSVRELEERSQRSKTGLLGDPFHKVPYQNHPYDKSNHNRKLQVDADLFQPMRIVFHTDALESLRTAENAAKIDFLTSEILPRTAQFWSQALSVVPVSGNLQISANELDQREYCGDSEFTQVPSDHIATGVSGADLILYVSGSSSSRFCSGTTLAVAVSCNFDQFDRPTAGAVNVCLDQIELGSDGTASEAVIQDNVDVLVRINGWCPPSGREIAAWALL